MALFVILKFISCFAFPSGSVNKKTGLLTDRFSFSIPGRVWRSWQTSVVRQSRKKRHAALLKLYS